MSTSPGLFRTDEIRLAPGGPWKLPEVVFVLEMIKMRPLQNLKLVLWSEAWYSLGWDPIPIYAVFASGRNLTVFHARCTRPSLCLSPLSISQVLVHPFAFRGFLPANQSCVRGLICISTDVLYPETTDDRPLCIKIVQPGKTA